MLSALDDLSADTDRDVEPRPDRAVRVAAVDDDRGGPLHTKRLSVQPRQPEQERRSSEIERRVHKRSPTEFMPLTKSKADRVSREILWPASTRVGTGDYR